MARRPLWLLFVTGVVGVVGGCASAPPPAPAPRSEHPTPPRDLCAETVSLFAWQDLPRDDERSHGLSGLAWDQAAHVLRAASDKTAAIQTLIPDESYTHFSFGAPIPVTLEEHWDVEGLALSTDRYYLGNEAGPSVHAFTRDGKLLGRVALPDMFLRARFNHGLESLTLTPDAQTLIVANEHAFTDDGEEADPTHGTTVRLVRIDLAHGTATQRPYTTDPVFDPTPGGRVGVVDIMAPSADTLYVTERGYVPGAGNSVRIYCVDRSPDKKLLVDLATMPDDGFPEPLGPQRNKILENFEGFSLGPTLPDGRRLVFAVSDDNSAARQTPRLLVLALTPR